MTNLHFSVHPNGLSPRGHGLHACLCQRLEARALTFLDRQTWELGLDDLTVHLEAFAAYEQVVICGTGGSSLGGQALWALAQYLGTNKTKITFLDDIDPYQIECVLQRLSPEKTGFVVISKSGHTAETLAQVLAIHASPLGQSIDFRKQFLFITHDQDTPLRRIARQWGAAFIPHPQDVGGRYSVLTVVGAVVAILANLSLVSLHKGAADMLGAITSNKDHHVFAAVEAIYAAVSKGYANQVVMTYCAGLSALQDWYRQLSSESLGKNGKGITPILARGTIDQHSQLQLYLDGPRDKFFTFLTYRPTVHQAMTTHDPDLAFLNQRSVGDLFLAEALATRTSIEKRGIPFRLIDIQKLDEHSMGELFVYFMVETVLLADLLLVNPFDQPAVEEGKTMTRAFMLA